MGPEQGPKKPKPEIPVPERTVSAHLAVLPIHNIALARKRGVMNHYRPLVAPAMFLAS